jgi:acyl dehydratase
MSRVDAGQRLEELAAYPDHSAALAILAGRVSGAPVMSPDAVNLAMIRHWAEAMGDHNPVYVSDVAAREAGFEQLYAPPTMLQAWVMRGLRASMEVEAARAAGTPLGDGGPNEVMMSLLEEEGLTSVVATNCEQTYVRPLVVGDRVMVRSVIESISAPKRTGLGTGRFITTRMDFVALPDSTVPESASGSGRELSDTELTSLYEAGDPVATMRFRILKYLPPNKASREPQ